MGGLPVNGFNPIKYGKVTIERVIDDTESIEPQDQWAIAAGCVSAAERTYPVIHNLASSESSEACRKALDILWLSFSQPKTVELFRFFLTNIEELPESSVDDSYNPAYIAMRAISVLAYALEARIGQDRKIRSLQILSVHYFNSALI